jgi:simple sugar transport system ATP-binding protein
MSTDNGGAPFQGKSPLLSASGLTKRFTGVLANDRLDFEVRQGEVHAVLGENGAGKSTLMNMLSGMISPDAGAILWKGKPVTLSSPRVALELGVAMVHQHFMLVPRLTVLENVMLGTRRSATGGRAAAERRLLELAREFETTIDPHRTVESLSVGGRQKAEILKAVFRNVSLLILDEPTASLAPHEAALLFRFGRRLASRGAAVIFITHRLEEVATFSDRVTVLRNGRNVGTFETPATNPRDLAGLMVGKAVTEIPRKSARPPGARILGLEGIQTDAGEPGMPLTGVSLDVREGEVVGIAGVDGNGQSELVEVILGLRRPIRGSVRLGEADVTLAPTGAILDQGLAVIPGDRHAQAILEESDLRWNALLGLGNHAPWVGRGWIRWDEVGRSAGAIVRSRDVKSPSLETPISHLSGGHQQRFVLGRTLARNPRLLVMVQPTRGLDVESAAMIQREILELRDSGKGILLVSMDLDEILKMSDRVAVFLGGAIRGWVTPAVTREEIGMMMAGAGGKASR